MTAQQGQGNEPLEAISYQFEATLAWLVAHRRALAALGLVLLVAGAWVAIAASRNAAGRRKATEALAAAVAIADSPLTADLTKAEAELADRRAERRAKEQERLAAAKPSNAPVQAAEGTADELASATGEEGEGDGLLAEEMAAEAAQLAEEQEAEDARLLAEAKTKGRVFADDEARQTAALAAFSEVADSSIGTPLSTLAGLQAAEAASKLQQKDVTLARLRGLYTGTSRGDDLWPVIAIRLATALERFGDVDGALAIYGEFGQGEQRLLADEAGLQRARLLAKRDEPVAAAELLRDIQLKFPNTPLTEDIRAALLELPAAQPRGQGAPSAKDDTPLPAGSPKAASAPPP